MSAAARGGVPGRHRWTGRSVWALLRALLSLAISAPGATAAEIGLSDKPGCRFELSGPIVPGDGERFRALVAKHGGWRAEAGPVMENQFCLDSLGGAFIEGRDIARLVHERTIPTRIGPNAKCVSACALVFLAGRLFGGEQDTSFRTMHVTGKLGLHTPFTLLPENGTYSGKEVNRYVLEHNGMIADLLSFSSSRGRFQYEPAISLNLLSEMLATPPEEMFMIDTVEKAARWDIRLEGTRDRTDLDRKDQLQFCNNKYAWAYDRAAGPVGDLGVTQKDMKIDVRQTWFGPAEFVEIGLPAAQWETTCTIQMPREDRGFLGFCLEDGMTGLGLGGDCDDPDFILGAPWWHAMPPDMPLAALR